MIGAALRNVQQTGLDKLPAVREKLADLVCYREGINAHLVAAIAEAQKSPGGLLMPHQSLLYAGRVHACANLPQMMHITRELCGGQICVTPNAASFAAPGPREWLEKFYTLNDNWLAEDRRKLLAFARDLLNSDHAGHRLTFVQFAQTPHFNHLNGSTTPSTFPARSNSSRRPRVCPIASTARGVELGNRGKCASHSLSPTRRNLLIGDPRRPFKLCRARC